MELKKNCMSCRHFQNEKCGVIQVPKEIRFYLKDNDWSRCSCTLNGDNCLECESCNSWDLNDVHYDFVSFEPTDPHLFWCVYYE